MVLLESLSQVSDVFTTCMYVFLEPPTSLLRLSLGGQSQPLWAPACVQAASVLAASVLLDAQTAKVGVFCGRRAWRVCLSLSPQTCTWNSQVSIEGGGCWSHLSSAPVTVCSLLEMTGSPRLQLSTATGKEPT